ncbi:MAG: hypothetical protein IID40_08170 [Planctomycetes bacterium]|nr:hypothetical protein [Planctomycetota bacterium]
MTDYVFEVTPAVGDRYLFVAWDTNDNRVYSVEITTVRTVYYMTLQTSNAPQAVPHATYRPTIEGVFRTLHTEMIHLGHEDLGDEHVDAMATNDFLEEVNELSEGNSPTTGKPYSFYAPFLLRLAFVDQLATSQCKTTLAKKGVPVGLGQPPVRLPIQISKAPATDLTADMRKPLWIGLGRATFDGSEETVEGNHWFVSATIRFPDGTTQDISHTHCTPVETDSVNAAGIYNEIDIRVDHLPANPTHGDITLKAIIVNRMVLGIARQPISPGSMIMASRHLGKAKSPDEQTSAAIHEVGHALQMVANFDESRVETHQYYYKSEGNHCHYSIPHQADGRYQSDPGATAQAGCLMFGQVASPPLFTFCADCQASIRKVDISGGVL